MVEIYSSKTARQSNLSRPRTTKRRIVPVISVILLACFSVVNTKIEKRRSNIFMRLEPTQVDLLVHGLSLAGASTRNRTLKYSRTIGDVLDKLDKG